MKNYEKIIELQNKQIVLIQLETELILKGLFSPQVKEVFSKKEVELAEECTKLKEGL